MSSLDVTRRILSWGDWDMGDGFGIVAIAAWATLSILAAGFATLSTWLFRRQQVLQRRLSRLRLLEADNQSLRHQLLEQQPQPSQAAPTTSQAQAGTSQQHRTPRQEGEPLPAEDMRLRTVLENMPVMLNAFNPSGEMRLWNAECERVTGYRASEILGNPRAMEWLYPDADYRTKMMEMWQSRGNDFRNWEWNITCKDGSVKTIAWSNISDRHPIRGWSTWAIGVDVSERKEAARALQQAKEAAEAANQAKSRFLANMSHELRTPLSSILGFSQLMASDTNQPSLPPQQQEYLNIINRSGEALLNLINDVLEVSKIEAGRVSLHTAAFDLSKLLQRLQETLALQAHVKELELSLEQSPDVPQYVQADESKLYQILLNLIGNAIKFTEQGRVVLRVSTSRPTRSLLADGKFDRGADRAASGGPDRAVVASDAPSASDGTASEQPFDVLSENVSPESVRYLHFEVEDTGPGIPTDDLKELFKPFAQTHADKNLKGTGLGLFISQRFVQLMEGRLSVESLLGYGTRFICHIPVQVVTQSHVRASSAPMANHRVTALAPGQRKFRVLVAEDRPTNRLLLLQILTPLGFEVWQAEHGQEAVEMAQKLDLDLILMDMRMPVMDGYDATRQVQQFFTQHPRMKRPKIIALTASAFEEDRRRMMALGCDDFIRKPFHRETFLSLLRQHLDVRYLYEKEAEETPPPPPTTLTSLALDVMTASWRQQLHYAAAQGSDRKLLQLIEKIPPEHSDIATGLTELVTAYRFDRVMELAKSLESSNR